MDRKYLLGVDLGTSSTKSALYTIEGVLAAEASMEVPIYSQPGIVSE
jgi:sugar (pentulose or hexulose) kinase